MTASAYRFSTVQLGSQALYTAVRPGTSTLPPLLLCNGIGAPLELLTPFIDALDPALSVIAFDAPGVGGSSTPSVPYRFSGLAQLLARLLDALGVGQVNVLGVSWGGGLAQQFARDYPQRCQALILAATAAGTPMLPGKPRVLWQMAQPRRYQTPAQASALAALLYGGQFRRDPQLAQALIGHGRTADKTGYYWQLFAALGWSSLPWLHRLGQPTLVLAGDDDPLIPLFNMRLLAWRIPDAQLQVLDDGHLFLITRATEVAARVTAFLQGVQANRGT